MTTFILFWCLVICRYGKCFLRSSKYRLKLFSMKMSLNRGFFRKASKVIKYFFYYDLNFSWPRKYKKRQRPNNELSHYHLCIIRVSRIPCVLFRRHLNLVLKYIMNKNKINWDMRYQSFIIQKLQINLYRQPKQW